MRHPLVLALAILLLVLAAQANVQDHEHAATAEKQADIQHHATEAMSDMGSHRHDAHMKMTSRRTLAAGDARRADAVVQRVKRTLDRYKDYRVAIGDGYKPVLPQLPLPVHHFTNYWHGFREALTFDPAKPTSLLYKKRGRGYELIGAMYTAPKSFSEEQLHERIPLSVATWHAHVDICLPPRGKRSADWSRFGFKGSISSEAACRDADGRWFPQLFGWMVHVYPYEAQTAKIWSR